jgi:hypothetical protein
MFTNFNYIDYDDRRRLLQQLKGALVVDKNTIEKLYLDLIEAQGAALRAKKLHENKEPFFDSRSEALLRPRQIFETFEFMESILSITRDYHNIYLNRKMQSMALHTFDKAESMLRLANHEGTFFPREISDIVGNPPKGN